MLRDLLQRADELDRRNFLCRSVVAALGVSLIPGLSADEPVLATAAATPVRPRTAKRLIYLYMSGGMSHLDTFDPKPGTPEGGPVKAIAAGSDGLMLSEYLPELAKHGRHCVAVRSMTSTQGAHGQGNYYVHTSYGPRGNMRHPCLGAWISRLGGRANGTLPGSVVIGGGSQHPGAGFMESVYSPLPLGRAGSGLPYSRPARGITDDRFAQRLATADALADEFAAAHDTKAVHDYRSFYDEATTLMKSSDLAAFDLSKEPEGLRDAYGEGAFGQGVLLARRLIEHDVRYIEVDLGGWDTHNDNFVKVPERAGELDQALGALIPDLESRGLLDETLIVVTTEFGRTPTINKNQGRDHYPKAFSSLLVGGGIKGGQSWGATNEKGTVVADKPVEIPDFNATIAYALGLPFEQVVTSSQGRPFTVADKGRPILDIF